MIETSRILVFLSWIAFIKCQMEPFIVGGKKASITDFPHSAFMYVQCVAGKDSGLSWICGGSIVNEKIILTAAHCVFGCANKTTFTVYVGHANKQKGFRSSVGTYYKHEKYTGDGVSDDIALLKLRSPLKFGKNVKKVALMEKPPYHERAQVAGWGVTNEAKGTVAVKLKCIIQHVWKTHSCRQMLLSVPQGAICASSGDIGAYCSRGDSGSALMVRGYIQIGIVSYKISSISDDLVVYTDTGYFYSWIKRNTKKLYCDTE